MTGAGLPLLLFDGDCGVCQNGTHSIRRRFSPPVDMAAYQSVHLPDLGVSDAEVLEGPVLVRVDGSHVVGPLAIAEMLRASRQPYRTLGATMLLPGIRQALNAAGPSLYRQRFRAPGAGDSCRMPQP